MIGSTPSGLFLLAAGVSIGGIYPPVQPHVKWDWAQGHINFSHHGCADARAEDWKGLSWVGTDCCTLVGE